MNKRTMSVFSLGLLATMAVGGNAMADQPVAQYQPVQQQAPKPERGYGKLRLGFDFDFGFAPNPANLELVLNPFEDMLTLHGGLSYNALSFGPTIGLRLDPLAYFSRLPIGLIGDVSGGSFSQGTPPGVNTGIKVGYTYTNLLCGMRLGRNSGFHWDFLVGTSWTNISTNGFQSAISSLPPGVSVGNPSGSLQITPTFLTGFSVVWDLYSVKQ